MMLIAEMIMIYCSVYIFCFLGRFVTNNAGVRILTLRHPMWSYVLFKLLPLLISLHSVEHKIESKKAMQRMKNNSLRKIFEF